MKLSKTIFFAIYFFCDEFSGHEIHYINKLLFNRRAEVHRLNPLWTSMFTSIYIYFLKQVRNRLLKAIKKNPVVHHAPTEIVNKNQMNTEKSTPNIISWVKKRPNMSWDFTLIQSDLGSAGKIIFNQK